MAKLLEIRVEINDEGAIKTNVKSEELTKIETFGALELVRQLIIEKIDDTDA